MARLVDVARHDADLAGGGGDDARAVGADEPGRRLPDQGVLHADLRMNEWVNELNCRPCYARQYSATLCEALTNRTIYASNTSNLVNKVKNSTNTR